MGTLVQEKLAYQSALIALLESLDLSTDGDGSGSGGIGEISDARMALVNLVKIKLDELIPQGEGVVYNLESEPNVSDPLDLYINGLLDEAAKNVLQTAPKHICPVKQSLESAIVDDKDDKIGYIKCPQDYLRLFALRLSEWKRQVSEPITIADAKYQEQGNKYTRGGTAKPVVAITKHAAVELVIPDSFQLLSSLVPDGWEGGFPEGVYKYKAKYLYGTRESNASVESSITIASGETKYINLYTIPFTDGVTSVEVYRTEANGGEFKLAISITADENNYLLTYGDGTTATYSKNTSLYEDKTQDIDLGKAIAEDEVPYTGKVLEYYSVKSAHTINRFLYIPIMAAEDTPGNLWDSISWICAGKILQNINLAELSKLAFEQANLCYTNLR
ncbi:hypothetical protein [Draconibacterium mangrovi]|uniref:hypothetical protein n=1 Tax=Draconibacterium mangrovi TaxID=2697469 RepID=UPI0013D668DB|nr:hypothetical protein [Draconibacterium mangrovi]